MTTLVPESDVALLYTLFGTAGAVGSLVAAPLLQGTLAIGIQVGGMLIGLPFFVIAAFYGLNTVFVWALKLRPMKLTDVDVEDDEPLEGGVRI
jgi:acyl CoA:acetate/3-ketoacid CoA transferase alpha subunit